MSVLKQILFILLIGAGVFGAVEVYQRLLPSQAAPSQGEGRGRGAVTVETARPRMHPIMISIEAVGTTVARQSINVTPLTSGRVSRILVSAGEEVDKGKVLLELDSDIERADLAQAEATLKEVELALERAYALRQNKNIPQATVDELTAKRATAQAAVDRARRKLADREIKAPFGGTVGMISVDVGARVDDSTRLTTLDDLEEVEVLFSVPEQRYGIVRPGFPVIARAEAFPDARFKGTVSEIDSRVDQNSRSFKVHASIPNPDRRLPAGMFMLVELVLEQVEVMMVPEESIVPQGEKTFVWLAKEDKAVRREVRLGRRNPGFVEITEGLTLDDSVIVKGTGKVRQGAPVRGAGGEERKGRPAGAGERISGARPS